MGATSSSTDIRSPYGGLPSQLARYLLGSQLGPLIRGFGFGGGPHSAQFEARLANATGPLADFIKQVRGFAPNVIGQAQQVGNTAAQQGTLNYNQLMNQIGSSLGVANQTVDYAQQAARDAFSPIRQSALFNQTANNVLTPLRSSQAARGLEQQGGAQQQEQNTLQNLGLGFAQNQQNAQQSALSGLGNAAGLGPSIASAGLNAVPAYQNLLSQKYLAPLGGAGGLLSLLSGGTSPGIQLTGATSPQLGTSSKGGGFWGCCSEAVLIDTPDGWQRIGDLFVHDMVWTLGLDGAKISRPVLEIVHRDATDHIFAVCERDLVSPVHPLASGKACGEKFLNRVTVHSAKLCDIRVGGETGFYHLEASWFGSTIDRRHQVAA